MFLVVVQTFLMKTPKYLNIYLFNINSTINVLGMQGPPIFFFLVFNNLCIPLGAKYIFLKSIWVTFFCETQN